MLTAIPYLLLKLFAVLCLFTLPLVGQGAVIDTDTIIDAASPFNGEEIMVVDGVGGPTSVRIVEGGTVAAFIVEDSSDITLDVGEVTLPSGLVGQSKLTFVDGTIACSEQPFCLLADFDAILNALDSSEIEIRGGTIQHFIRLFDQSTLTVFGNGLTLNESNGAWFITGTLLDGKVLDGSIATMSILLDGDPAGRIFLVQVPEPSAGLLVSVASIIMMSKDLRIIVKARCVYLKLIRQSHFFIVTWYSRYSLRLRSCSLPDPICY